MRRLPSITTVRADFDRIAETQRRREEKLDPYEEDLLALVPAGCRRALEVGCGIGLFTRALAGRACAVDAVDLSPSMIAIAQQRTHDAQIRYRVADILTSPMPGAPWPTS
jgi:SAM-dependent methyltransferase